MSFLINPFAFAVAGGDFEPIATVTVGSGGASSIEFTSIPGTYQHLQIRMIGKSTGTTNPDLKFQINGDTGSNYASHVLRGTGSAAQAYGYSSQTFAYAGFNWTVSSSTYSVFSVAILDVLDYANTSKNTTVRTLSGVDTNGGGEINVWSGLWMSTNAVNAIKLYPDANNFAQYSTAALYGVKA